jgi:UDP-N-acetylglucosamine--dolichyl-phosphate N-acetylglucosaminephosphotransferase
MMQVIFGILSFAITLAATPVIGRRMEQLGFVGVDLHKDDGRKLPEMTGIALLLGFAISGLLAYSFTGELKIAHGLLAVLLVGLVGLLDGVRKLKPREKMIGLAAAGFVLLPVVDTTLLGFDLGILYIMGIPIFFAIACNFTNMLAGFNGLEIGTGAIASLGIAILALLRGAETSFLLAVVMAGGLMGFLYYNRYPARVFPGDVGTLPIGAALFSAVVLGKFEVLGAIVFIPYAVDAALKYKSVGVMTRESQRPTQVREGKLFIPPGGNLSLPRIFLRKEPLREYEVVHRVWAVEGVFCAAAILASALI